MRTSILRRLSAVALFAAALSQPARADGFATANVQLLQAFNMYDASGNGNDASKGDATTVTFNYFGTWDYGDLLMFLDVSRAQGHFTGPGGGAFDANVYGEVQPRFGLGKLLGVKVPLFRDFGPAFELNQGSNFYAYLAGLGGDFALPGAYVGGVNVYYRYDKFVGNTAQATVYWGVPFQIGPVPLKLAGFADFTQALDFTTADPDDKGLDIVTQPQLLADVGSFFGKPGRYWMGTEYWLHKNPNDDTQALQAMFQWTLR